MRTPAEELQDAASILISAPGLWLDNDGDDYEEIDECALAELLTAFVPLAKAVHERGAVPFLADDGAGYKAALKMARSINAATE